MAQPANQPQPPAPSLPFVTLRGDGNGYLTPEAFQFLQNLFNSIGGSSGLIDVSLLFVNQPAYRETSSGPVSWTPVVRGSTTAGGHAYSTQWGWSAALGPVTVALFNVALTANDPLTAGDVQIAGLPVASATSPGAAQGGWLSRYGDVAMDTGLTQLGVDIAAGSKVFTLRQSAPDWPGQALPASGLTNTSSFVGGAIFFR